MLLETCNNILEFSDLLFVFIQCFFGLVLEKMEHWKNVKNGVMSRLYRVLPVEVGFKPLHTMHAINMNDSAVDQTGQV